MLAKATHAAEQTAEAARRQQALADARYRRSIDNAAVGMCLTNLEGRFTDVNDAMCRYFGYDAASLTRMTWQELTAPSYLDLVKIGTPRYRSRASVIPSPWPLTEEDIDTAA